MKTKLWVLLIALVVNNATFAQEEVPEEMKQEAEALFWGPNDLYKNKNEIPEKWKDESAVILYKNENYDYHKRGKQSIFTVSFRERIKLLDNAAIEEYSEISYKSFFSSNKGRRAGVFGKKGSYTAVGIKIVKPDGTEHIVDVEGESIFENGKNKLAVTNLEVGDVLDYYFYTVEHFKTADWERFKPVENTLAEQYPVVDYKLTLDIEKDFFITFKSFNGAPKLVEVASADKDRRHYELIASDIDKYESERYFFPLVQRPSYKFQNVIAKPGWGEKNVYAFIAENESTIKEQVSKNEVLELFKLKMKIDKRTLNLKDRDIKKKIEDKSDVEKAKTIYYYLRYIYTTRNILPMYAYNNKFIDVHFFEYKFGYPLFLNEDFDFATKLISVFSANEIPFELYIAKKRYDGSIEDLLFVENINFIVKTNTTPPLYFENFDPFTEVNEMSPYLDGTEAYVLKPGKKEFESIEEGTLPVTMPEDNLGKLVFKLKLDENLTGLMFNVEHSSIGYRKDYEQQMFLVHSDFIDEDYEKFETIRFLELFTSDKKRDRIENGIKAYEEERKAKQKEWFEEKMKHYLSLEKLDDYSYNLKSTGRFDRNDPMVYEEKFNVKDNYIKKAGPNLLVEIGKAMGNQIQITEKEKKRKDDVYKEYPVKYITEIRLEIPEGYEVKSLDNLRISVDNETGSFSSTAEVNGNELIVVATEIHNNYFEKNANWQKFVEVLDAAYKLSNEKILLSRK